MRNFYAGDKQPFTLYLQDQVGAPINGTGWSAILRFNIGSAPKAERAATLVNPTDPRGAKFQYVTTPSELVAGTMHWEWTVSDGVSVEVTGPYPRRTREIVARLA